MEITDYKIGDENRILDLFQQSFDKPMSYDFWKWRYQHNPFFTSKMIKLMWDKDNLVGHYAVFPIELILKGEPIFAALSMTTMTHPEYTGRGIFKTLAELLYTEIAEKQNVKLVWGFPNKNSHSGFIKSLKWNNLGIIATLKLKVPEFKKIPYIDYILCDKFSTYHETKIKNNTFGDIYVNKSVKYLNWRYFDNPINKYYIIQENTENDFLVIKCFNSFEVPGKIEIDILEHGYSNSFDIIHRLTGSVLKFAYDNNIDLYAINTWMSIEDPKYLSLEKINFINDCPLTFIGFRSFTNQHPSLNNFLNWNITMGDSDVY